MLELSTINYQLLIINYQLLIILLILIPQCRQRNVVFHSKQTDGADGNEGSYHRYIETHVQTTESPVDETTNDASHRINLLAEDNRLLVEKYITDNTTERTRNATHDDCHPERETAIKGLLDSCNIEKRQTESIEKKPGIVETLQIMMADDDNQLSQQRKQKIDWTRHPERSLPQHHITDGSATDGNSHTTHKSAQPVVMLAGGKSDARKGKRKGSYELDDTLKRHHQFRVIMNSHFSRNS